MITYNINKMITINDFDLKDNDKFDIPYFLTWNDILHYFL